MLECPGRTGTQPKSSKNDQLWKTFLRFEARSSRIPDVKFPLKPLRTLKFGVWMLEWSKSNGLNFPNGKVCGQATVHMKIQVLHEWNRLNRSCWQHSASQPLITFNRWNSSCYLSPPATKKTPVVFLSYFFVIRLSFKATSHIYDKQRKRAASNEWNNNKTLALEFIYGVERTKLLKVQTNT